MFGLGFWEILLVFLIVLVLFGAKRIPELGSGIGEGIRNFTNSFKKPEEEDEKETLEKESTASKPSAENPTGAPK